MALRVSTTDIRPIDFLKELKDDLAELQAQVAADVPDAQQLVVQNADEHITELNGTYPKPFHAEPTEGSIVQAYSEPEGGGIKYRSEADARKIILNSAACYLFDEWKVAARNAVTAAESLAGIYPPSIDPQAPKWEIPAAKIEADKMDHNIRKVRDIFDPPQYAPPTQTNVKILSSVPTAFDPPVFVDHPGTYTPGTKTIKLNSVSQISAGDTLQILPDLFTKFIVSMVDTVNNEITLSVPLTAPTANNDSVNIYKFIDANIPMPIPEAVAAIQEIVPFTTDFATNILEEVVLPVSTPLTQIIDKSENNFHATIIGPPPLPSTQEGPFGPNKGRAFLGTETAFVQIEPLSEGSKDAVALRQGPECALSAVFCPSEASHLQGCTLASVSSPPVGTLPFLGTRYSLQLISVPTPSGPRLFPRLVWSAFVPSVAGITSPLRTCYAQSLVPVPMVRDDISKYPASNANPRSTNYFVGVTRWKKELNMVNAPLYPIPLSLSALINAYGPLASLGTQVYPNFENPKSAFNVLKVGDFVTLAGDGPTNGIQSYHVISSNGNTVGGFPVEPGSIFWDQYYQGNPPKLLPLPQPRKLYSLGVTFYIGDLSTGQFIIDDFVQYGMDEPSFPFIPGVNNNLPFPATGEYSNFIIGGDLNSTSYVPNSFISSALYSAGLASSSGLDVHGVIASGIAGIRIPSALTPVTSGTFSGDYYLLNIPPNVPEDKNERDKMMTDYFNACFADYKISGKTIARSGRSQIPDGGDVYLNYDSATTLENSTNNSEIIKTAIDAILASSTNPNTNNTDSVSDAVGIPRPGRPVDGPVYIVDGQTYLPGDTPVDGFKRLTDILGYDDAAIICTGTPSRPVLVTSIEQTSVEPAVDACGNVYEKVTVIEKILGVDISISRALLLAGVEDPGLLIQRLFWVGGLQPATVAVQTKLKELGLYPEDIAAVVTGASNGTIEVYEIPDQNITQKLRGSPETIKKLFTDYTPVSLALSPSSTTMRETLVNLMSQTGAATTDGLPGPVPPVMALFRELDLAKTFGVTEEDLQRVSSNLHATLDEICRTALDGLIASLRSSTISMAQFRTTVAPLLELLNYNLGTATLNLQFYIPCLVNFTSTTGKKPSISVSTGLNIKYPTQILPVTTLPDLQTMVSTAQSTSLPTPQELLDRLTAVVPAALSMVEKLNGLGSPLQVMLAELPVIATAIESVSKKTAQVNCVPKNIVDALLGKNCGIAIPQSLINTCVTNNPEFQLLLQDIQEYVATCTFMITRLQQQLITLNSLLASASNQAKALSKEVQNCIQQVSHFMAGLSAQVGQQIAQTGLFNE